MREVIGEIEGKPLTFELKDGIVKYYLGTDLIGVYDPKTMTESILFLVKTKENAISHTIKDKIENLIEQKDVKGYVRTHKQYEEKDVEKLKQELGLGKDKYIKRIALLDLEQKVEKDDKKTNDKDKKLEDKPNFSTTRDINIKQEMDLSNKTTDMKTLGQLLKKEGKIPNNGKDYIKLAIVESDDISNINDLSGNKAKENITRYQFVLVASDKTVIPIDLEQDSQEQSTPVEENYQIMRDGEVRKNSVLSRYKLGSGTLAIDNEEFGEIKAYYSQGKTLGGKGIEGNQSLDVQLETSNVWEIDKKERDRAGNIGEGYRQTEYSFQELGKHNEECRLETPDADGDKETTSHIEETVVTKQNINNMAKKILEQGDLGDHYNLEDVKAKLQHLEGQSVTKEELKGEERKVEEFFKKQSLLEHELPGRLRGQN